MSSCSNFKTNDRNSTNSSLIPHTPSIRSNIRTKIEKLDSENHSRNETLSYNNSTQHHANIISAHSVKLRNSSNASQHPESLSVRSNETDTSNEREQQKTTLEELIYGNKPGLNTTAQHLEIFSVDSSLLVPRTNIIQNRKLQQQYHYLEKFILSRKCFCYTSVQCECCVVLDFHNIFLPRSGRY